MKFSLMFVTHIVCPVHDTHAQSSVVDWPIFYTYPDPSHIFYVMGPKYFSEIPFQDLYNFSQLRYTLTYVCHTLTHQAVVRFSLTWIETIFI